MNLWERNGVEANIQDRNLCGKQHTVRNNQSILNRLNSGRLPAFYEPEYDNQPTRTGETVNKVLIFALQNNDKHILFCDMSPTDQMFLREFEKQHPGYIQFYSVRMSWETAGSPVGFVPTTVYRINPAYQPKPEYEICPITEGSQKFLNCARHNGSGPVMRIFAATGERDFVCFLVDDEEEKIEFIAQAYRQGKKCEVKFIKSRTPK